MPRSEKWTVSPKFEKNKSAAENICSELVADLIEKCCGKLVFAETDKTSEKGKDDVSSSPVVGVWVPDPTLPEGWKTCCISRGEQRQGGSTTPEKRMFYSPCGKLFSSRLSLDRFLEGQNTKRGGRNQDQGKIKMKSLISPKSEVIRAADLCTPKIEAPDSDDDASDAISLSDDDFEDCKQTQSKRKYEVDSYTKCPKPKKRKLTSHRRDNSNNLTTAQEKILGECYNEWPLPFPDLVEQLVKDTGLVAWVIDDWYVRKTDRCLQMLFSQGT